jgi:anthranilate synthase component 1
MKVVTHARGGDDADKAYDAAVARLNAEVERLRKPLSWIEPPAWGEASEPKSTVSRETFMQAVETAKEHIRAGDIFQVVLSHRMSADVSQPPFEGYRALRVTNPSPYMYFLRLGEFAIVGSSPEVLVRRTDSLIEVRPIAGTRPRGRNADEDRALEEELRANEKERAEHVMLVDLGRNDLGRVCEYGSVAVDELMTIETYSHVMHIVSSVSGTLRSGLGAMDALRACLPAGTLSGAPKIRAMEVIDELEPVKRGFYGGAIGYLGYSGDLDTCIHIRTVVVKDGIAHVQAGAGVVADSDPASEYRETQAKAGAVFQALELACAQPDWA